MGKMVEVDGLVKKYNDFIAVDSLSFQVNEGIIYGFLGPNGAGKSTTLSIIATLLRFNSGNITVGGYDIHKNKSKIRNIIGWVPQDIVLYPQMSIKDNIRFYGSLYGLKGAKLDTACKEALKVVALLDISAKKVNSLSGGMQRRLNIACGIVHKPKLVIMDEPTVGVDAQSRDLIMQSIKTLNEMGSTIIYTSHYMHEVEELCSEIGIINKGKMVAEGSYEELAKEFAEGSNCLVETSLAALNAGFASLQERFPNWNITRNENQLTFVTEAGMDINDFLQEMIRLKMPVMNVSSEQLSLEDIFLKLTGKTIKE